MSDCGPGIWVQVTLNDMLHFGKGYMNFLERGGLFQEREDRE
jgi:Tfp pilus assembly protein PilZ